MKRFNDTPQGKMKEELYATLERLVDEHKLTHREVMNCLSHVMGVWIEEHEGRLKED